MFFNGLRGKIEKFYVPFFPSTSTPIIIPHNLVLCDSRVLDLRVFFFMKTLLAILPYKKDFRSSGNHAHPVATLDTLLEVTRCTERTGGYAI